MSATDRFVHCVETVFEHEGGFSNHPADPGGATNRGITLKTLRSWRRNPALGVAEIRNLTRAEAEAIYRAMYWEPMRAGEMPVGVDLQALDFAVNAGPHRAAVCLQRLVGVKDDGEIGPITIAAVWQQDRLKLIHDYCQARVSFLRSLPTWRTFGKGWLSRCEGVRDLACKP